MASERWGQIESIYHGALARPLEERARYLREACGHDAALRREVESLLDHEHQATEFFKSPRQLPVTASAAGIPAPPLKKGQCVGPYVVADCVGVGGMGEVFSAHDTRLRRNVALKVLPATFAADRERFSRFEREARLLAALNHPNIAAIYGLEYLTESGAPVLVLELVQGETLAERIGGRPLAWAVALAYARQIADALDA